MRRLALVFSVGASGATAGGIDLSGQSVLLLFRPGGRAEFAAARWFPQIEGKDATGASSGNVSHSLDSLLGGVKKDFGDRLSVALIADQPYGVGLDYPTGRSPFGGTIATTDSVALTGLARWRIDEHFSLHGGVRAERISANIVLDGAGYGPLAGYTWDTDPNWGFGYVAGASWEMREIGALVALTYSSEIRHSLSSSETMFGLESQDSTEVTMPQSVNLDFQTGVTPRTLLYGSLRWVNWDGWNVAPPALTPVAGPLIVLDADTWTYRLGVGRQVTDAISAAVEVSHESPLDAIMSPLVPYDGYTAVTLGSTYALPSGWSLSGLVSYGLLGSAQVSLPGAPPAVSFEDGRAVTAGLRIAVDF